MTTKQLSYKAPVSAAVAIGATTPDPGQPGCVIWSTITNTNLSWNGSSWQSLRGADGASGVDGQPGASYGSMLLTGGQVAWVSGYTYIVSAATYMIAGVQYASPQTQITLSAADGSNPRIDTFALTTSSTAVAVAGTAAATPVEPNLDPSTQLGLSFAYVAAGSSAASVTTVDVYKEGVEWTAAKVGAPITIDSTNNPRNGTKDIEATVAVDGNYVQFTAGAAFDPATINQVVLYIRSKASWTSTVTLVAQWFNGGSKKGSPVVIKTGAFGFNSATTGSYQQIAIPMSAFGMPGVSVDRLRFTVSGSGTGIGFYLDDITLQSGVAASVQTGALVFRGGYNATVQYIINDVVRSGEHSWIAIQNSLNQTPSAASTYWVSMDGPQPLVAAIFYPGVPTASVLMGVFSAPAGITTLTFAAAIAGSSGKALTAATAQTDIDVRKNATTSSGGSSVGTIRFAAAGTVPTFIAASGFTLTGGTDYLSFWGPATPDATLANISASLYCTR